MVAAPELVGSQVWQFGDPEQRIGWLRAVRQHDPAVGLAALAGTWVKESGPDRAAFVGVLALGLTGADEDFLEAALDDRVPQVRRAAAELLAVLPESGYAGADA